MNMMMNFFCKMVNLRPIGSGITRRDHRQEPSPLCLLNISRWNMILDWWNTICSATTTLRLIYEYVTFFGPVRLNRKYTYHQHKENNHLDKLVLTFLITWLISVHIFCPRRDNSCHPVFIFRSGISNAIKDIVLYLLGKGWNTSSIYDSTFPLQYLKRVAISSTVTKTVQYTFLKGVTKWFKFLLPKRNHDVGTSSKSSKWVWIKCII